MKKRMILLTVLSFFLGFYELCIQEVWAETPETQEILSRMEKKYAGRDFSADFHQISTLTALEITETASGKVYFSHPGKMRWEYLVPTRNKIISDGNTLWIYRPDENQVVKGNAQAFFATGAGGAFLSNISLVREQYSAHTQKKSLRCRSYHLDSGTQKSIPRDSSHPYPNSQKKRSHCTG